ncbi:kinase-like domain-containing protein, partial [Pavlovales sp. CCMP2436]
GSLKLIDFGIAKKLSNDTTNISRDSQVGTVNYMSPESITPGSEQTGNLKLGRPSDVWSLGCILYAMVYGRTPFEHVKNMLGRLRAIADFSFQIEFGPVPDANLLDVVKRCLRREPNERPTIPELLAHPFLRPPAASEMQPPPPTVAAPAAAVAVHSGSLDMAQMMQMIQQLQAQVQAQQQVQSLQQQLQPQPVAPPPPPPMGRTVAAASGTPAGQPTREGLMAQLQGAQHALKPTVASAGGAPAQSAERQEPRRQQPAAALRMPSAHNLQLRAGSLTSVASAVPTAAAPVLAREILERHGRLNHVETRTAEEPGKLEAQGARPPVGEHSSAMSGWAQKAQRMQEAQRARGEYTGDDDEPSDGLTFT